MGESARSSPYLGLVPYDEQDADYFFGRERETRIILANLFASRLTLLYGPSGVGKSSVLRAGVAHGARARDDLLLVVFAQWQGEPLSLLKRAITAQLGPGHSRDGERSLGACIAEVEETTGRRLMVLLDQFDEYFLYHPGETDLDEELCEALGQEAGSSSFLISLREDSLAGLDRYDGRISGLFDNYLRVEHLDAAAARSAIVKPLERFNAEPGQSISFSIDLDLVDAVVGQVQASNLAHVQARYTTLPDASPLPLDDRRSVDERVEAPYLQLVMTRLWNEEREQGSTRLRLATLERLGGAESIVTTHLDRTLSGLPHADMAVCATIFHYLVTPSGTKIAHTLSDLAKYAQQPVDNVRAVVEHLSGPARILRPLARTSTDGEDIRYEIYHDVLARSVQEWRGRYLQVQARLEAEREAKARQSKRRKRLLLVLSAFFVFLAIAAGVVYLVTLQAESTRRQQRIDDSRNAESSYAAGLDSLRVGDYQKALSAFATASELYGRLDDRSRQLSILVDTGRVLALKGDTDAARASYQKALDMATERGDPDSRGIALERLGALEESSGHIDRALPLYESAGKEFSAAGDQQAAARILERLGSQAEAVGDFTKAVATYEAAIQSYTLAGDPSGGARATQARDRAKQMIPWGYLVDLQTGTTYALRGGKVSVGRSVPADQVQNDIVADDPFHLVSRRHLEIRRNWGAEDIRSTNGTTVNAVYLPYGQGRTLASGDIVVLGGALAFMILDHPPARAMKPPPGAWGMLLDGGTRRLHYLAAAQCSVRVSSHGVSVVQSSVADAALIVRKVDESKEILAPKQEWRVAVWIKEDDYTYNPYWLKTDTWLSFPVKVDTASVDSSPPPIQFQNAGVTSTDYAPVIQLIFFE